MSTFFLPTGTGVGSSSETTKETCSENEQVTGKRSPGGTASLLTNDLVIWEATSVSKFSLHFFNQRSVFTFSISFCVQLSYPHSSGLHSFHFSTSFFFPSFFKGAIIICLLARPISKLLLNWFW